MTVVAFLIQPPHTYAVYYYHHHNIITEVDDMADLVWFDIIYDPFRTRDLVVVDLSRLS